MARLIAAGQASLDLPFKPVSKKIFESDTVFVDRLEVLTGGDALNVAVGLNMLGAGKDVRLVSLLGEDVLGALILQRLRERGVDTSGIILRPDVDSMATGILIDENNERHFLVSGDSYRRLSVEDVLSSIDHDTEFLHIGSFMTMDMLERDHAREMFSFAREKGIKTSFDVTYDETGAWLEKIRPALPYTDIFFASYDEAVCLTGGLKDPKEITAFFRDTGIGSFVLKLGPKGCYASDYSAVVEMPTYTERPVVDTTGAGDSFVAAYLYGVLRGFSMEECCLLGNVNGTLSVGSLGANTGCGTYASIRAFIEEYGSQTLDKTSFLDKL